MEIEQTEIILKKDGSAVRRTMVEEPCNVVEKISQAMSASVTRVIKHAGCIDGLNYHIVKTATETYCVMALTHLNLTAPYKLEEDGMLRPQFDDRSGENPTMQLQWPAPSGMMLVFAARMYVSPYGIGWQTRYKDACYLLAMDSKFISYLLPLPNLYDTGYMCMGEYDGNASNAQDSFKKAFQQLMASSWNADLYSDTKRKLVNKLMSFKPDDEKFTPVPCPDWQKLLGRCEGMVIEMLKGAFR